MHDAPHAGCRTRSAALFVASGLRKVQAPARKPAPSTVNMALSPSGMPLEHRRERTAAAIQRDPARLGEGLQRPAPAVLADAGGLEAAERHMRLVIHRRAIDVAIAG